MSCQSSLTKLLWQWDCCSNKCMLYACIYLSSNATHTVITFAPLGRNFQDQLKKLLEVGVHKQWQQNSVWHLNKLMTNCKRERERDMRSKKKKSMILVKLFGHVKVSFQIWSYEPWLEEKHFSVEYKVDNKKDSGIVINILQYLGALWKIWDIWKSLNINIDHDNVAKLVFLAQVHNKEMLVVYPNL